jgi:hypothetical protein
LTATSLYSQTTYPSKIRVEEDTLIVITPKQLVKVNSTFQELEHTILDNKRLNLTLDSYRRNTTKMMRINELLQEKNTRMLVNYSEHIKLNNTNKKLAEYYRKEIEVQKRKKVWSFFGGFTIGVAITSTLILLLNK